MRSIWSFIKTLMKEPDRSVSFKAAAATASTEIKQDGLAMALPARAVEQTAEGTAWP